MASVAYFHHVLHLSLQPDREVERKEGLQLARKHSLLFIGTHLWDKNFYTQVFILVLLSMNGQLYFRLMGSYL